MRMPAAELDAQEVVERETRFNWRKVCKQQHAKFSLPPPRFGAAAQQRTNKDDDDDDDDMEANDDAGKKDGKAAASARPPPAAAVHSVGVGLSRMQDVIARIEAEQGHGGAAAFNDDEDDDDEDDDEDGRTNSQSIRAHPASPSGAKRKRSTLLSKRELGARNKEDEYDTDDDIIDDSEENAYCMQLDEVPRHKGFYISGGAGVSRRKLTEEEQKARAAAAAAPPPQPAAERAKPQKNGPKHNAGFKVPKPSQGRPPKSHVPEQAGNHVQEQPKAATGSIRAEITKLDANGHNSNGTAIDPSPPSDSGAGAGAPSSPKRKRAPNVLPNTKITKSWPPELRKAVAKCIRVAMAEKPSVPKPTGNEEEDNKKRTIVIPKKVVQALSTLGREPVVGSHVKDVCVTLQQCCMNYSNTNAIRRNIKKGMPEKSGPAEGQTICLEDSPDDCTTAAAPAAAAPPLALSAAPPPAPSAPSREKSPQPQVPIFIPPMHDSPAPPPPPPPPAAMNVS